MTTVLNALRAINAYPIPVETIDSIATKRGLMLNEQASMQVMLSRDYRLATADIYLWLADCPNISQGGQNYTFSDEQRKHFRNLANEILKDLNERVVIYGYKGTRL